MEEKLSGAELRGTISVCNPTGNVVAWVAVLLWRGVERAWTEKSQFLDSQMISEPDHYHRTFLPPNQQHLRLLLFLLSSLTLIAAGSSMEWVQLWTNTIVPTLFPYVRMYRREWMQCAGCDVRHTAKKRLLIVMYKTIRNNKALYLFYSTRISVPWSLQCTNPSRSNHLTPHEWFPRFENISHPPSHSPSHRRLFFWLINGVSIYSFIPNLS